MINEENNNKENTKNIIDDQNKNIKLEKNEEESDKDESKDSIDSTELDQQLEDERLKFLNNPNTFQRKRDFFSFYSKHRQSAIIPQKKTYDRSILRLNTQILEEKPEFKRFSKFELKPRGFGVKIKERIEFFEKKALENKYKTLNLMNYQKTYYENDELRKYDVQKFEIQKMENIILNVENEPDKNQLENKDYNLSNKNFSFESKNSNTTNDNEKKESQNNEKKESQNNEKKESQNNEKKESQNKLNLNLIVDYSKILNSSKITKKEKVLDLFMTESKESKKKQKIIQNEENDSDKSSDSLSFQEVSTNSSHGIEQTISKHSRQKSEICYYKDILNKITESDKKINLQNTYKDDYSTPYQNKGSKNNSKYILVQKNDNKIRLEKKNKYNCGIKKVLSENISDNATLKKLDNAKYKLIQANNNQIIKRQISDMLEQLIFEKNNKNKANHTTEKIDNIYDRQKLIRAFEIIPQLSSINQKIKTLIQNTSNSSSEIFKDKYNEKEIRQSVSSIYFLECIGIESIILFNGKNKFENKKIINDISEDIQLAGITNKKKFMKFYLQNLQKANYFLDILINIIKHLKETINIPMNK